MRNFHVTVILALVVSGCVALQDPPPRIVSQETDRVPGPAPKAAKHSEPSFSGKDLKVPADWYPPASLEHGWDAIVIHHSGTANGNTEIFDRWHREGNHWEGVGYDFVIGNGTDSPDGAVEVTFRWQRQMVGAHCKTPNNWANRRAVGICLVGNFNETRPTSAQLSSLRKLIGFLQQRYRISAERIYGHQETPGAIVTDCPGRFFNLNAVR